MVWPFWGIGEGGRWCLQTQSTPIQMYLLRRECGEFETLWAFHVGSRGGESPTYHRGLSTKCSCIVGIGHSFAEEVQNNKTGATWPLADWVERTTSRKDKMVLHGEGRGNVSSPHLVKLLGTKILPKWGVMIHIGSLYNFSSISVLSSWKILKESSCISILAVGPNLEN